MPGRKLSSSRRAFLGNALKLGAGSLLFSSASTAGGADKIASVGKNPQALAALRELPTRV
jgi:hypothetical protein